MIPKLQQFSVSYKLQVLYHCNILKYTDILTETYYCPAFPRTFTQKTAMYGQQIEFTTKHVCLV